MSTNQLFEPEGDEAIHLRVSKPANKLLNDWLDLANDFLETEYENYMKKKKNSNHKNTKILGETDMEVQTDSNTEAWTMRWLKRSEK